MPYADPEKRRANWFKNHEERLAYQRAQYCKHREKRLAAKKAAYDAEKQREKNQRYYAANQERLVEYAREYRRENAAEVNAKAAARYERNREVINERRKSYNVDLDNRRAYHRNYAKENDDRVRLYQAKIRISETAGIPYADVPDDLAEAKREELKIGRWLKEQRATPKPQVSFNRSKQMSKRAEYGRSGAEAPSGYSAEPKPVVSAVPVSIPNAGDIGIVEHQLLRDEHEIVRVVKAGKLNGMWTVERYERPWLSRPEEWSKRRRRVSTWMPLPASADPERVYAAIEALSDNMRSEEKAASAKYHALVAAYAASGIETGTAKSEALSAEHESPTAEGGDAQNHRSQQH